MKKTKEQLALALDKYTNCFPEEHKVNKYFRDFIDRTDDNMLYDRSNQIGHITVSAVVATKSMDSFLLLAHHSLKKWLQPGGHVDAADSDLLSAACREVEEETGFSRQCFDVMASADGLPIIDIGSHYIPANPAKSEGEHFHHDIRFLFRLKRDENAVVPNAEESDGWRWASCEEFAEISDLGRILLKIGLFTEVMD